MGIVLWFGIWNLNDAIPNSKTNQIRTPQKLSKRLLNKHPVLSFKPLFFRKFTPTSYTSTVASRRWSLDASLLRSICIVWIFPEPSLTIPGTNPAGLLTFATQVRVTDTLLLGASLHCLAAREAASRMTSWGRWSASDLITTWLPGQFWLCIHHSRPVLHFLFVLRSSLSVARFPT